MEKESTINITLSELSKTISKILEENNLKIADCNFYINTRKISSFIPKAHHVPSNIVVSPVFLAKKVWKELLEGLK